MKTRTRRDHVLVAGSSGTTRRRFCVRVARAIVAGAAPAALAQREERIRRIGYLSLRAGPGPLDLQFLDALKALGHVEGRNLVIEYRWAADDEERLPALAAELVQANVDVIVTSATPAISAAMRATGTIPIVMQSAADPVGSGFVTNLARPGGNVSGMTILSTELAAKRLQLMRELVPNAKRASLLAVDNAFATPLLIRAVKSASEQLRLELVVQLVKTDDDLSRAFAAFDKAGAGALIVQTSPFIVVRRDRIVELAARHRLPAMYEIRSYVDAGGLVAYGPDGAELFRRSAGYVDKILNGARAGDLPIEQPTKYELAVNLKTARTLGLAIPGSFLARADAVIR
jgi:putative ABC transport system substrate-binding protein